MPSKELTSEKNLSFSVLQRSLSPKQDNLRVSECGFQSNLS